MTTMSPTRAWIRRTTFLAIVLAATACASGGARRSGGPKSEPPEMLSRRFPEIRIAPVPGARAAAHITVEVQLDSLGRPDMNTLRTTGEGSAENRDAIVRWIAGAQFRPAREGEHAVPGVFRTTLEPRVEVRRVRLGALGHPLSALGGDRQRAESRERRILRGTCCRNAG
jgi:hypothetical protein